MKPPRMRGVIDRRILVNYRVDPAALASVLPRPLRPKLVRGSGIGGICLIRLVDLRPSFLPSVFGVSSENAAHRIAVVLPDGRDAVFIPRRDTSSRLNVIAGGRIFPGLHHRGRFDVHEDDGEYSVSLTDEGGTLLLSVRASVARSLPRSSVFESVAEASSFFEAGSLGYSPGADPNELEGLELCTQSWHVEALDVEHAYSGFFEEASAFPPGAAALDCALLMEGIDHEWRARDPLYCGESRRG